jgi:hypothetical protein
MAGPLAFVKPRFLEVAGQEDLVFPKLEGLEQVRLVKRPKIHYT